MRAALAVADVCFSYGATPVLRGVDLTVPEGQLMAVLGPSGCGKTTLLRVVVGFERPSRGVVRLGAREVSSPQVMVPPERRGVGLVPQEGALFPHLSVARNVGFGLPRRDPGRAQRVARALGLLGVAELADRMPHELSGGQQQRVAVARALAPGPEVVVLDEPFSALDATLRARVRGEVRAALRQAGTTSLLVTHDQEEAFEMADQIAVMLDGRIRQVGSPDEVYHQPVDVEVARFVGDAVELAGTWDGSTIRTALGPVLAPRGARGPAGAVVRVLVRPEQVRLGPADVASPRACVTALTSYGHDVVLALRTAPVTGLLPPLGPVLARATRTSATVGDEVGVRLVGVACVTGEV